MIKLINFFKVKTSEFLTLVSLFLFSVSGACFATDTPSGSGVDFTKLLASFSYDTIINGILTVAIGIVTIRLAQAGSERIAKFISKL
ncbi:hypothetical protein HYB28_004615 [Salmonella enterica]|nr:hypothetical protein [Salmonella enterica]ECZ5385812.1 hypothetical protein [Salmonella enterica subsp. enterica serovar Montevideo]EFS0969289.1 hypothetical protein [Salmonella enterica]